MRIEPDVQALRSCRTHPSLSDCVSPRRSKRRANLLYAKVPHATIKARTIAAIPIVNQKSPVAPGSRWSIPRFAGLPNPLLDAASLERGGFSLLACRTTKKT
jgi:hypothetical protein